MNLFKRLNLATVGLGALKLNKVIQNLSFHKHQMNRNNMAHFCEHDGICINFTQAKSTWHALAPCALKPWWLFLQPSRLNPLQKKVTRQNKQKNNKQETEVTENA